MPSRLNSIFLPVLSVALLAGVVSCRKPQYQFTDESLTIVLTLPQDLSMHGCSVAFYSRLSGKIVGTCFFEGDGDSFTVPFAPREDCNAYAVVNPGGFIWPQDEGELGGLTYGSSGNVEDIPFVPSEAPVVYSVGDRIVSFVVDRPLYVKCVIPLTSLNGKTFVPSGVHVNTDVDVSDGAFIFGGVSTDNSSDMEHAGSFDQSLPFQVSGGKLIFYVPVGCSSLVDISGYWTGTEGTEGYINDVLSFELDTREEFPDTPSAFTVSSSEFMVESGISVSIPDDGYIASGYPENGDALVVNVGTGGFGYRHATDAVTVVTLMLDYLFEYWTMTIYDGNGKRYAEISKSEGKVSARDYMNNVFTDFPVDARFELRGAVYATKLPFNRLFKFYERMDNIEYEQEMGKEIPYEFSVIHINSEDHHVDALGNAAMDVVLHHTIKGIKSGNIYFLYNFEKVYPYEFFFSLDEGFTEYLPSFSIEVYDVNGDNDVVGTLDEHNASFAFATPTDWSGRRHYKVFLNHGDIPEGYYLHIVSSDGVVDMRLTYRSTLLKEYVVENVTDDTVVFTATLRNVTDDSIYGYEKVDIGELPGKWKCATDITWTIKDVKKIYVPVEDVQMGDTYTGTVEITAVSPHGGKQKKSFNLSLSEERKLTLSEKVGSDYDVENNSEKLNSASFTVLRCDGGVLRLKARSIHIAEGDPEWFLSSMEFKR